VKKFLVKKISHISHDKAGEKEISSNLEIDLDELDIDSIETIDSEDIIKKVFLAPAGYPIKPFDVPNPIQVSVTDNNLFQAYATEQWLGLSVKINDYIFDQLIIPDFAFKIKKLIPKEAHRIAAETRFVLIQPPIRKPKFKQVSFDDVIGNEQALSKAKIIVKYLKNPEIFGEWAPKNILFHGPPGTGKTLTAKAIASTAKCAFFAKKGTSLIGNHVGDGASKIHSLYKEAKSHAPAIIFIDELDSVGLSRAFQNVRGDVIEVAASLLAELDGLETSEGVITIGATNTIGLLDSGLRSRFEEEIEFPIPTEEERFDMLKLFSKKIPFEIEIDFEKISKNTENWSGRALHEKLIKISVHKAIQQDLKIITTDLLMEIINQGKSKNKEQKPPSNIFT
jgi:AAA family ATPase